MFSRCDLIVHVTAAVDQATDWVIVSIAIKVMGVIVEHLKFLSH